MSESFKTVRAKVYILSLTKTKLSAMPALPIPVRRNVLLLHALSGALLASFIALHLINHALVIINPGDAFALMETLRRVYRWPPVEMLLMACVIYQVASGPLLAASAPGKTEWATKASGYYLLFFVALHVAAVFWGRYGAGLDTNIYFAAAGLHAWPYAAFFSVYYFLAVVAVHVHLGQAIFRRARMQMDKRTWLIGAAATGTVTGALIVAGMSGWGNDMQVPAEYMSVFQR